MARTDTDTSNLGQAAGDGAAMPAGTARKSGNWTGSQHPTQQPGQYPADLFGVPLPQASAPGTPGAAAAGAADPTLEPGQYPDRMPIAGTPLKSNQPPGTPGAQPGGGGGVGITVTGVDLMANTPHDVTAVINGRGDWTASAGAYPAQHPIAGTTLPGAGDGPFQPAGDGAINAPGNLNNMNRQAGQVPAAAAGFAPAQTGPAGTAHIPPHPNNMNGG